MRNHIITPCNAISSDECAVPCKRMSRIVRGGLYMYSNRHHLNAASTARDRYTRKKRWSVSKGRSCYATKTKSLICGWFVGVELRTQHLVNLRPHVSLAGCQAYAICRVTYWTSVRRDHWSDISLIFVCKPILHYIVYATYMMMMIAFIITLGEIM